VANTKTLYSSSTSLDVTAAATLANATSASSVAINNTSTGYFDFLVYISITSGSGATTNSIVEVWAKGSLDGTNFEDDNNDHWVGNILLLSAGAQTQRTIVSCASGFSGPLPPYMKIRLRNVTGAALTAASSSYVGVLTQSAA
jgi:hypothetical protein